MVDFVSRVRRTPHRGIHRCWRSEVARRWRQLRLWGGRLSKRRATAMTAQKRAVFAVARAEERKCCAINGGHVASRPGSVWSPYSLWFTIVGDTTRSYSPSASFSADAISVGDDAKAPEKAASHQVHEGAACSAAIVPQIQSCGSFRCCDDGTLTTAIADLVRDHRNDIRPDFRICSDALEIDCDLLASYTPHTANWRERCRTRVYRLSFHSQDGIAVNR